MASTEREALAQTGPEAVAIIVDAEPAAQAPDLLPAESLEEGLSCWSAGSTAAARAALPPGCSAPWRRATSRPR